MIGRGSRILNNKTTFSVIDLGNNFHRFGPWGADLDWQTIFKSPNFYTDRLLSDEELESNFKWEMPEELRAQFAKSGEVYFDIKETYVDSVKNGESSKVVLERSIAQHARICVENSEDVYDALALAKMLGPDIDDRIQRYAKCISKSTFNFLKWLTDDYHKKLSTHLRQNFDVIYEDIHGRPPEE
jgi:hypothetical protein